MKTDEPWLILQPGEHAAISDDGGVYLSRGGDGGDDPYVVLSPAYQASPKLLFACKRALGHCRNAGSYNAIGVLLQAVKEAERNTK